MNAYIVDDEVTNRQILKYMIQRHCPGINIVGESDDYTDAILEIQKKQVDILFMDVHLGQGKSGFDVIDALKGFRSAIVFVTAHEEFALQAFEYGATHYILKPIDPVKLVIAVNRIMDHNGQKEQVPGSLDQKISLPRRKGYELILVDDIIYVEAKGSYAKLVMKEEQTLVLPKNLKFVAQKLEAYTQFIRVHSSFLVNQKYVSAFYRSGLLELNNKKQIPVSNTYKAKVGQLFG